MGEAGGDWGGKRGMTRESGEADGVMGETGGDWASSGRQPWKTGQTRETGEANGGDVGRLEVAQNTRKTEEADGGGVGRLGIPQWGILLRPSRRFLVQTQDSIKGFVRTSVLGPSMRFFDQQ